MKDAMPAWEASSVSAWSRENVVGLARRIRSLRVNNKIRIKDLIIGSGLVEEKGSRDWNDELKLAQQRFSRWINNAEQGDKWKLLKEGDYRKIISYIFSNRSLLPPTNLVTPVENIFPDVVFHGVADWIVMDTNSINDVRENFTGSYAVYRPSLIKQGFVLIGHLNIYYDEKTGAVKTEENYRVIDSDTSQAVDFRLQGYIFRRNGKFRILSKHLGQDELQYMYIGAVMRRGGFPRPKQVLNMSGVVSDVQAEHYYCTRIAFERDRIGSESDTDFSLYKHNECNHSKLDTVPPDSEVIPERVRHILSRRPELTKDRHIVTF